MLTSCSRETRLSTDMSFVKASNYNFLSDNYSDVTICGVRTRLFYFSIKPIKFCTQEVYMDKISGIIPQTPRSAPKRINSNIPVRPGAPSFGRPEGSVEIRDRVNLSSLSDPTKDIKPYKNPRDAQHVKIAESVTKKFFNTPDTEANEISSIAESIQEPAAEYESRLAQLKEY